MGTIFAIIIVAVITFAFVLWPTKKAAQWFGAENATYGHVIFALIVAFVLSIGAGLFVIAAGLHAGWILIIVAVAAAYAKVLGTTFFRGLGIYVVSSLIAVGIMLVLQLVLGGILGIGNLKLTGTEKHEGKVTLEVIEEAAEDVCRCGTDGDCLQGKMGDMGKIMESINEDDYSPEEVEKLQKYSVRAFQCALQPKPYVGEKKKKKKLVPESIPVPEQIETTPEVSPPVVVEEEEEVVQPAVEPQPEPEPEPVPVKYEWRKAELSELPQLLNSPVEIETTRGTTRKGFLNNLDDGSATVGKSRHGDGLAYEILINEIKSIKVYEKVQ